MAKISKGEYTLMDIVAVAMNPAVRTAVSPFGAMPTRYVGRSVPWKGVRGIENLKAINSAVASGLTSAIGISRGKAGVKGVVLVRTEGGAYKIMPRKSAEQSIGRPAGKRDRVAAIIKVARTSAGLLVPGVMVPMRAAA